MQYCRLLNGRTFFWATEEHLERLLNARVSRNRQHDVLTVDTKTLVREHLDRIKLSSINSVAAISQRDERERQTFKSIADCPFNAYKKRPQEPLVELAVKYEIGDIWKRVLRVERRRGPKVLETVWGRRGRSA